MKPGLYPVMLAALASAFSIAAQGHRPTFRDDIRPILARKCVSCHSTGGQGPFALQTYAQVKRRADLVRLVCLTGQMPPTDAHSEFGQLSPAQPLEASELKSLQDWIATGCPEGGATVPLAGPRKLQPIETDHVFATRVGLGRTSPAEGRAFRVTYPLPRSFNSPYLGSFRFQPDSPQAVRQVVLAVQRKGAPEPFTSTGIRSGTAIAAWSSGFNDWSGGGAAYAVGKEDQLWLQVKGVPTGKPEPLSGIAQISREYRSDRILTKTIGTTDIDIPAEAQMALKSEWVLDRDIALVSLIPECRFTTEQVRVTAEIDGQPRQLLTVVTWDAIWPGAYNFARPVELKKGTRILFESVINNSKHGHAAEGEKTVPIRFGPGPTNEIFWCHFQYFERP